MTHSKIYIHTEGERFYSITANIKREVFKIIPSNKSSGILFVFVMHTSCALLITESYDPSAQKDMETCLQNLIPRDASFIIHTLEGPDDSPSHMKSMLLHQSLALLVEEGDVILGQWQGIFLAEFRDLPKRRTILLKFIPG